MLAIIDAFQKEHPETRVRMVSVRWEDYYQKVPAAIVAGKGPDVGIMHVDQISMSAAHGVLRPLDDVAEGLSLAEADFAPDVWQSSVYQGKRYGIPLDVHPHTLEGPFVVHRDGRYFLLYSGGAWEEPSYGVSYAVADHPVGPYREPVKGPAVLRTRPGLVLRPGHNSVVQGPRGDDWIVYHAWDPGRSARRMCIDRLVWGADGPAASGPSADAQPAP